MSASIQRTGDRAWAVVVEEGLQPARGCTACKHRVWVRDHRGNRCPKCGGGLGVAHDVRRQRWHRGFKTQREAKEARSRFATALAQQEYVGSSKITLAAFLAEWLEASRNRVRPTTLDAYRVNIATHIVPTLGSMRLQQLTPERLNAFYAMLSSPDRPDRRRPLSPKSVRNIHVVIRKALQDAMRWGRLTRNVATLADPPKARQSGSAKLRTWSRDDLALFLKHVADDRLQPAWLLVATTGMRRGELLGLRWRDVDLEAARVSVRETIVVVDGKIQVSTPKTARGRRQLALDARTTATLRTHRTKQAEERMLLGLGRATDDDLVFANIDGRPVHPDSFSGMFERHVRDAKLPKIRLHDVRHTYATLALQVGIHPKVVSERLGHSTVAFTLDVYSHVVPAMAEDAAQQVADLILGPAASS